MTRRLLVMSVEARGETCFRCPFLVESTPFVRCGAAKALGMNDDRLNWHRTEDGGEDVERSNKCMRAERDARFSEAYL